MGKLGKKARKFAKKNLQSVMKRQRKQKSVFKKRATKKGGRGDEVVEEDSIQQTNDRSIQIEDVGALSFDAMFNEHDSDVTGDDSGSDGYLSEEAGCTDMDETKTESNLEDSGGDTGASVKNRIVFKELAKQKKKLDRLKGKDPGFVKYLESMKSGIHSTKEDNQSSDADESDDDSRHLIDEDGAILGIGKLLSSSTVDSLCQLVKDQQDVPSLVMLLNAYRAGSHYGTKSFGVLRGAGSLAKIMIFVLQEANDVFRKILGVSSSSEKKVILELRNTATWEKVKPLIKLYLRSTMFLLNEVTDSEILTFVLKRLRASIIFFAAFPSLLQRLIKISIHLWTTSKGALSVESFLVMQNVAGVFNSDLFDTCFDKAYKTIIGHCKFVDPAFFGHLQFLKKSFIELCSQDMQKSLRKAIISIRQLAKILQLGLQTKQKEAVKRICSWQYVNCIDLWVEFISVNIHDYNLLPLLHTMIQIINGVAVLYPGPRYLPLRVKTVQWLNLLSSSCGTFIPIASLALDILEYKIEKEGQKAGKDFTLSSDVKLPKHWMKSRNFLEACVFSALELLAVHFAQWGYHISFPELATIPLIHLKKFHDRTSIESSRRLVKRFIDQVEQNVEFVRKKRDEVAFSPKDEQLVASFLQMESSSGNLPFIQYYKSLIEKAASRDLLLSKNLSFLEPKKAKGKKQRPPNGIINAAKEMEIGEE
ncbi:unnamed protein product [Linum tenue]|uniref:Nucleolar complex protein 2 homolog n=1 Tax=Linum tenue TaxID=586396 RepID=A0AAV0M8J2_9ROSI|nr:unnamed protein product [Linum tenue]